MMQCAPTKGNRQQNLQPPHSPAVSATLPLALALEPMGDPARAASLARELALPLIDDPHRAELLLVLGPQGLALRRPNDPALNGELRVDFDRPAARRRQQSPHRELVVQAARLRRAGESPLVVDATAGLGRDGFLLAAAGFRVVLCERNPVVAALRRDGLARAALLPRTAAIAARIRLIAADFADALEQLPERPAVIYLDPMFPPRSKSAKVKQELQLLQLLEGTGNGESDAARLLQTALAAGPRKVVVKRPLKGPALAGPAPSHVLRGKAVRFDVYTGMAIATEAV